MMLRTFVLRADTHAQQLYAFLKANWRAMADQDRPLAVIIQEHKAKRSGQPKPETKPARDGGISTMTDDVPF